MPRKKHPKKEIEAALQYAESKDWRIEVGGSHAWGKLYCPFNDGECRHGQHCLSCIWSTPKNASYHARHIRQIVDHCQRLKQLH